MARRKLIRNLRPGDEILVTDETLDQPARFRVRVTHVQEGERGAFTGQRRWFAYFEPRLKFGSWEYVWGYSGTKIEVL